MSIAEANLDLPANFTGVVKLFPLPNLVLFPGVIQPLHIFEPRYRKLLRDAIDSDQLIAMCKLKPHANGSGPEGPNPEIHKTLCVGKIMTHAELPDGRFNLFVLGAKRAKLIRELATELPYRLADVQLLESASNVDPGAHKSRRQETVRLFRQLASLDTELDHETSGHLLNDSLPFGLLLDMVTFSSGASLRDQQDVLETIDVERRAAKVIEILQSRLASKQKRSQLRFQSKFSYN